MTQGVSPSLVKGGPTPGVLRKTKVAPKRKSHFLPSKVVNWVKGSLSQQPRQEQVLQRSTTHPLPVSPYGPQASDRLLSLQPLINSKSISVFKVHDSVPVTLGQEVGDEFSMRKDFSPQLLDGVTSEGRRLDFLTEAGFITVTKVAAPTPQVPAPALS